MTMDNLMDAGVLAEVTKYMTGFCKQHIGPNIRLSQDCCTAVHTEMHGKELHGGLLGNGPLERSDQGWYFEVRVDSVRPGLQEGMAIGVTTQSPAEVKFIPE